MIPEVHKLSIVGVIMVLIFMCIVFQKNVHDLSRAEMIDLLGISVFIFLRNILYSSFSSGSSCQIHIANIVIELQFPAIVCAHIQIAISYVPAIHMEHLTTSILLHISITSTPQFDFAQFRTLHIDITMVFIIWTLLVCISPLIGGWGDYATVCLI